MAGENVCHFVRKALVLLAQLALPITIKRDVPAILLLKGMALQSVLSVRMILIQKYSGITFAASYYRKVSFLF